MTAHVEPMAGIRVRSGGVEREVAGEAELQALLRTGQLPPGSSRWDGQEWRPIAEAAPVADPWAAWNEVDETAAEALRTARSAPVEEEPAELPVAALTPMPRAIIAVPRPDLLPVDALTPLDDPGEPAGAPAAVLPMASPRPPPDTRVVGAARTASVVPVPSPPVAPAPAAPAAYSVAPERSPPRIPTSADASRSLPPLPRSDPPRSLPPDLGQIIDFPARPPRTTGLRAPTPESTPLVRPGRLAALITGGVLVLGGLWAVQAMSHSGTPQVVSVGAKVSTAAAPDPFKVLEKELRAGVLGEPRPVRRPPDLGDAVLVELQKLNLDVVDVRAPVTRWTGRKGDDPDAAELHVVFHPSADLNHDLGAILLVAGRYKLRYDLELAPIEAIAQDAAGSRAATLDGAKAEAFAKGRIGLAAGLGLEP